MEHPDPHRNNEKIVTLATYPSPVEAEVLVTELCGAGIVAEVAADNDGALEPGLAMADGYPVLVFEGDVEAATRVARDLDLL